MLTIDTDDTIPALRGTETPKAEPSRGVYCLRLMALILIGLFINILPVNANIKITTDQLKLYAYNQMSWPQMECYNYLIWLESRWNPKAINGSHYGLGQMRNKKVKYLNGYQQIDWHIKYLKHRYNGDACKALHHFKAKGWH